MTAAVADYHDGMSFTGAASTDALTFGLLGGNYAFSFAAASWGGGSIVLNQLQFDGSTYVAATDTYTANGSVVLALPPGRFKIVITTTTGVMGSVSRIPRSGN